MNLMAKQGIHWGKDNNKRFKKPDMQIQLIEGQFQREDALDLITQMIHVKIRFHEKKIDNDHSEEDIRARETKIKKLQKELFELRQQMKPESKQVKLNAVINLD